MIKINSVYSKLLLANKSSFNIKFLGLSAMNKLEYNQFNKISFKNFYFQESKHGAGDVRIKLYKFFI